MARPILRPAKEPPLPKIQHPAGHPPFIERLNLTIRQSLAYLARRTLSHARSKEKLEDHLELVRCHYNFVRPHRALRFGRETRTPAMQAGLVKRRLTLREIFVCT